MRINALFQRDSLNTFNENRCTLSGESANTIGIDTGGALTTQSWSAENRLLSYADSKGNSEQFLYSDDGLKKKRTNGSAVTLFTYDEAALLLETDASNNLKARYTNSPETWGGLASQSRSGVSSFYGFDSQLCARILVSMAGLITDEYSWKAFGEAIQTGSGTVNPYGYIALGLYYFELADLVNAWNRWLKASIGRWGNRDKLGFDSGSWNPYEYVGNNPVRWSDPSGLMHSMCSDTKPGTVPGSPSIPWKVIPDPEQPVTLLPHGFAKYCWIVVDQYCDSYCNSDARLDERVQMTSHGTIDIGPGGDWIHLGPGGVPATLPQFCDIMSGAPGTANYQCYRVVLDPSGEMTPIVLEPCPFVIRYGPKGPVRSLGLGGGGTIHWG